MKVEKDESVLCDIYNTNGQFVASTDGRKMISPSTIDVFDLSMAIAEEIVTNKKEDILSRVPTKFIKAYPNLKRAVLLSRPVNGESVILNTELGGLGSLLRLFESGRSSVLMAEELYKMYGSNFVNEYLKKQGALE